MQKYFFKLHDLMLMKITFLKNLRIKIHNTYSYFNFLIQNKMFKNLIKLIILILIYLTLMNLIMNHLIQIFLLFNTFLKIIFSYLIFILIYECNFLYFLLFYNMTLFFNKTLNFLHHLFLLCIYIINYFDSLKFQIIDLLNYRKI